MIKRIGCGIIAICVVMLLFVLAACVAIDLANRRAMDIPMFGGRGPQSSSLDAGQYDDPVDLGKAIYNRNCSGCHSLDGASCAGPTFQGLYGSDVSMDDKSTMFVDEAHLRQAITDPQATTRDGYPDIMPRFNNLDDDELDALVAFIRSLQ